MTTSQDAVTPLESTQSVRTAPHTILLDAVAVISWITIVCLKAWQWGLTHSDTWGAPATDDAVLAAGIEAWIDVLFIVAISATVGLIVLGAVRHMLNQLTHSEVDIRSAWTSLQK
ncbi:MAG: hypothetical protein ACTHY8_05115 [Microbacterium gubbeenense]|uniref:hypothetical protein n=1 Tax=Microbacterium TaxID=33882 RepID=UPI003F9E596E